MQPISRGSATKAAVAVGLLIVGLACAGLYRVLIGSEHHAYASGAVAPQSVHVTEGKTYQLSVPGGVRSLERQGIDVGTAQCNYQAGTATGSLAAQASGSGTKATNVVATFVAPITGTIHVDCAGWGAPFVDNADNAPADLAGGLLVVAVVALTVGFGLGVSGLRSAGGDPDASAWTVREDEEIERLVHLVHVRSQDGEIGTADGDDVVT